MREEATQVVWDPALHHPYSYGYPLGFPFTAGTLRVNARA